MKKKYMCKKYPGYSIGGIIKFVGGYFETDNPRLQKIIESDQWFGDPETAIICEVESDKPSGPVKTAFVPEPNRGAAWSSDELPRETVKRVRASAGKRGRKKGVVTHPGP